MPQGENQPKCVRKVDTTNDEDVKSDLRNQIDYLRKNGRKKGKEVDITVTNDGRVWVTQGVKRSVTPIDIQNKHKISLKGSYSIHNHVLGEGSGSLSGEDIAFHLSNGIKYTAAFQDACETGGAPQIEAAFYWISSNENTAFADYDDVLKDFKTIVTDFGWALNETNENLSEDDVNFHEAVSALQKNMNLIMVRSKYMAGASKEFLAELKILNEQYLTKIYALSTIYKTQGREPYDDACHLEDYEHAKEVYALREKYGYPNKSKPKLKMR